MNTVKYVLNLLKTDHKLRRVFGSIALFLMCLGILVSFAGDSTGWEKNTKPLIASGLGLIGSLIFILTDNGAKLFLYLCGIFSAVFTISLLVRIIG